MSGAEITSDEGTRQILSVRLQAGDVDVTVTICWSCRIARELLRLPPAVPVHITATTADPTDKVVLYSRQGRRPLRRMADGTCQGRFLTPLMGGMKHLAVNALSHGTLFDDAAPYDQKAWGLPYMVVMPMPMAHELPDPPPAPTPRTPGERSPGVPLSAARRCGNCAHAHRSRESAPEARPTFEAAPAPIPPTAEAIPEDGPLTPAQNMMLCAGCVRCCTYVAVEVDAPDTPWQDDQYVWLLYHKNIWMYVEKGNHWYVQFETVCDKLSPTGSCNVHGTHPVLCKKYDARACERRGELSDMTARLPRWRRPGALDGGETAEAPTRATPRSSRRSTGPWRARDAAKAGARERGRPTSRRRPRRSSRRWGGRRRRSGGW